MNLVRLIDFLRDRLKAVVRVCCALLVLLVAADFVRWFLAREHHEAAAVEEHAAGFWATLYHVAENTPGFWSIFGLLSFLFIVFFAKWYGNRGILTREDYYNE
ncbi:MAG: hypothetical protein WC378_07565 [Opitutaceae bacterium]|jgi:hypothetical protein